MPNYSYRTLAQAQSDLAARLYDPTMLQWLRPELTVYITEALRTWNALTSFWRNRFAFPLVRGQWWYDLTAQPGTLRPYTVTDNALTQTIEYHLLEPLTTAYPLAWTGSKQFALTDILDAITRSQNKVLGDTGCTVTRQTIAAPGAHTVSGLGDSTIDIRRVSWLPSGTFYKPTVMRQSDVWAKRCFDNGYLTASQSPPQTWMQSTDAPPQFDVDRVPPVPGQYDVLTVNAGPSASTQQAQTLVVPDDWSWVVKWAALGDLLSRESNAKDAARAQYCYQRYQQAVQLMTVAPAALSLILNDAPLGIDALTNGDNFNSGWQAKAQGTPLSCYSSGLNMLAFPAPDAGPYSALVSVVQNAPVPVNAGDFIQAARDNYDVILDMAQHLAMFKQGGAEFFATMQLLQNFLDRASLYNNKLAVMGPFQWKEYSTARYDKDRNPIVAVA